VRKEGELSWFSILSSGRLGISDAESLGSANRELVTEFNN
jgi:hypothetical protein